MKIPETGLCTCGNVIEDKTGISDSWGKDRLFSKLFLEPSIYNKLYPLMII